MTWVHAGCSHVSGRRCRGKVLGGAVSTRVQGEQLKSLRLRRRPADSVRLAPLLELLGVVDWLEHAVLEFSAYEAWGNLVGLYDGAMVIWVPGWGRWHGSIGRHFDVGGVARGTLS